VTHITNSSASVQQSACHAGCPPGGTIVPKHALAGRALVGPTVPRVRTNGEKFPLAIETLGTARPPARAKVRPIELRRRRASTRLGKQARFAFVGASVAGAERAAVASCRNGTVPLQGRAPLTIVSEVRASR
jgi:hypothetical protein